MKTWKLGSRDECRASHSYLALNGKRCGRKPTSHTKANFTDLPPHLHRKHLGLVHVDLALPEVRITDGLNEAAAISTFKPTSTVHRYVNADTSQRNPEREDWLNTSYAIMPSFADLPNEVLTRIRPLHSDLFAVVLVSHHLYDVYTPQLYHSFIPYVCWRPGVQYEDDRKRRMKREVGFLLAIFENPRLASCVKQFHYGYDHDDILEEYAEDQRHELTPCSSLKALMYANQSYASRLLDVFLPRLPGLENLHIYSSGECLMPLLACSRLKDVCLWDQTDDGNPMHPIATLLSLPTLIYLRSELGGAPDLFDLAAVPDRSSSVQHIIVSTRYHCINAGEVPINPPFIMQTICRKLKSLKSLCLERCDQLYCTPDEGVPCQNVHNSCLQPALAPFKQTLESLQILWTRRERCRSPDQEGPIGSLRDYTKLHTIELAPDMLFDEPMTFYHGDDLEAIQSRSLTVAHTRKPRGHFSGLLPSSLRKLRLYADTDRSDRVHTYWLELIQDLLADRTRLAALKVIIITQNVWEYDPGCMSCEWLGETCSLCAKSKISDTMKSLCTQAGIKLRIEKGAWPLFEMYAELEDAELEDADTYADGIIPYNRAFDDLVFEEDTRSLQLCWPQCQTSP